MRGSHSTGSVTACAPTMKPSTCRAFASRRLGHRRRFRAAVAELGVVRRSLHAVPRITPAMANSETNITSGSSGFVSDALRSFLLLGFAHAGTLAAMRGVSPVPASFARRLLSSSVRAPVRFPRGFPPTPKPRLVSQPPIHQHGPLHAAARSAASISTRRSALSRAGCRESEQTPNPYERGQDGS